MLRKNKIKKHLRGFGFGEVQVVLHEDNGVKFVIFLVLMMVSCGFLFFLYKMQFAFFFS